MGEGRVGEVSIWILDRLLIENKKSGLLLFKEVYRYLSVSLSMSGERGIIFILLTKGLDTSYINTSKVW